MNQEEVLRRLSMAVLIEAENRHKRKSARPYDLETFVDEVIEEMVPKEDVLAWMKKPPRG